MKTQGLTSKTYFFSLTIIHTALLMGQVFLGLVAIFLHSSGKINVNLGEAEGIFLIAVPFIIIAGIMGSMLIFRSKLKALKGEDDLKEKLNEYRGSVILKFAMLEAPAIIALSGYFITGNWLFLGLAGFIIAIFLMEKPSKQRIIKELQLNKEDQELLNDPEAVVAYGNTN